MDLTESRNKYVPNRLSFQLMSKLLYPYAKKNQYKMELTFIRRSVCLYTDCRSANQIAEVFPYFDQYTVNGNLNDDLKKLFSKIALLPESFSIEQLFSIYYSFNKL